MQLTPEQQLAINILSKSKLKEKFYWSGGTLLAHYYLQHRRSEDLAFFTDEKFSFNSLTEWIAKFEKESGLKKTEQRKIYDRWELLFTRKKEFLRVEFVFYNHSRKILGRRKKLLGITIDSLEDIAANKTLALIDRNEPKDLYDIYFLIKKKNYSPEKLIDMTNKKFDTVFPLDLFWSKSHQMLKLLESLKPLMLEKNKKQKDKIIKQISNYFHSQSNQYLSRLLDC